MESKQRDGAIDLLKIVATIIIILHHYQQITGAFFVGSINFYNGKFYFGNVVELFFLMSGMLTYSYIEKIQNGLTFPEFYSKKFFRFFPLMTLGVVYYEISQYIVERCYQASWSEVPISLWSCILTALGMDGGWFSKGSGINNPTWYICVLLLCYVLFFFFVYLAKRWNVPCIYFFIVCVCLAVGASEYNINLPFLNETSVRGYIEFFAGLIFAHYLQKKKIDRPMYLSCLAVIVILPLLMVYANFFVQRGLEYLLGFFFYPALIIVLRAPVFQKAFSGKVIRELSNCSLSVFVIHYTNLIVLYIIQYFVGSLAFDSKMFTFVFVLVTYLMGMLVHYLFEKPVAHLIAKKKQNS